MPSIKLLVLTIAIKHSAVSGYTKGRVFIIVRAYRTFSAIYALRFIA